MSIHFQTLNAATAQIDVDVISLQTGVQLEDLRLIYSELGYASSQFALKHSATDLAERCRDWLDSPMSPELTDSVQKVLAFLLNPGEPVGQI